MERLNYSERAALLRLWSVFKPGGRRRRHGSRLVGPYMRRRISGRRLAMAEQFRLEIPGRAWRESWDATRGGL
jgi:hypothetical protein